jgi:hypothetical protein
MVTFAITSRQSSARGVTPPTEGCRLRTAAGARTSVRVFYKCNTAGAQKMTAFACDPVLHPFLEHHLGGLLCDGSHFHDKIMRARHSDGSWHSKTTAFYRLSSTAALRPHFLTPELQPTWLPRRLSSARPIYLAQALACSLDPWEYCVPDAARPVAHVPMHSTYPERGSTALPTSTLMLLRQSCSASQGGRGEGERR